MRTTRHVHPVQICRKKSLRVSCWTAYILLDDTRSLQYQVSLIYLTVTVELRNQILQNQERKDIRQRLKKENLPSFSL